MEVDVAVLLQIIGEQQVTIRTLERERDQLEMMYERASDRAASNLHPMSSARLNEIREAVE